MVSSELGPCRQVFVDPEASECSDRGKPGWRPKRVSVTPAAAAEPHAKRMLAKNEALNLPIDYIKLNRIAALRGKSEAET